MGKLKDIEKKIHRLETGIKKDTVKLSKLKLKAEAARKAKTSKPKKGVSASQASNSTPKAHEAPASTKKRPGGLTPEGRARLAAAAKARWAAKKAAAPEATDPVSNET